MLISIILIFFSNESFGPCNPKIRVELPSLIFITFILDSQTESIKSGLQSHLKIPSSLFTPQRTSKQIPSFETQIERKNIVRCHISKTPSDQKAIKYSTLIKQKYNKHWHRAPRARGKWFFSFHRSHIKLQYSNEYCQFPPITYGNFLLRDINNARLFL